MLIFNEIRAMQKVENREAITLVNQDQKIFGIIHRPLTQGKSPAIVICPGFGGNKSGKFRLFVTLAQELARLGITVLRFDYRGSGDSEGEFQEITLDGKISDTLLCLDFLAKDSSVDPNRIGIFGRSLGGAIAVLAARRYQHIKSLVLWAPVFHSTPWQELWKSLNASPQGEKNMNQVMPTFLPFQVPNLQFIKEFFKIQLEKELDGLKNVPLLHIHGEQDTIVKVDQAEAYKRAREGVFDSRFVLLPKADHDFSDSSEQKIAIKETCQWYEKTL